MSHYNYMTSSDAAADGARARRAVEPGPHTVGRLIS